MLEYGPVVDMKNALTFIWVVGNKTATVARTLVDLENSINLCLQKVNREHFTQLTVDLAIQRWAAI
jgi:hypothetical protein